MSEIGKILKEAREQKNITLEEVEKSTKIRQYYIKSLEEDKFENLPGKVYATGFLKTYANYLNIPTEKLVKELKEKFKSSDTNIDELKLSEVKEKNLNKNPISLNIRKLIFTIFIIGLFVFVYMIYNNIDFNKSNISNNKNSEELIYNDQIQENNENQLEVNENKGNDIQNIDKIEGVNLELSALKNDKCWIRVIIDGEFTYEGTLSNGMVKKFKGEKEIRVKFGNPAGLKIVFNGKKFEELKNLINPKTQFFTVE